MIGVDKMVVEIIACIRDKINDRRAGCNEDHKIFVCHAVFVHFFSPVLPVTDIFRTNEAFREFCVPGFWDFRCGKVHVFRL